MSDESKSDAIEMKKMDTLLENLKHLEDRANGVRNRVYSAMERLNGSDDAKGDGLKEPPIIYGTVNQAIEKVEFISGILDDCHSIIGRIESSV